MPPIPAPICSIGGEIIEVEFREATGPCPPRIMPCIEYPERFVLNLLIKEVKTIEENENSKITCKEYYILNEESEAYIFTETIIEKEDLKIGKYIQGETGDLQINHLKEYSMVQETRKDTLLDLLRIWLSPFFNFWR